MNQWLKDFRWALNVMRARRLRRSLIFSRRRTFDALLRPTIEGGMIAYPDAFYCVTLEDVHRAYIVATDGRPEPTRGKPTKVMTGGDWTA